MNGHNDDENDYSELEEDAEKVVEELESNGRKSDLIIFDEAGEVTPEMVDSILTGEPFEFECNERYKDDEGTWYVVTPLEEYDKLDFGGHTVFINGRERLCDKFEVSENGTISILVR